jgi:hypothetical protein
MRAHPPLKSFADVVRASVSVNVCIPDNSKSTPAPTIATVPTVNGLIFLNGISTGDAKTGNSSVLTENNQQAGGISGSNGSAGDPTKPMMLAADREAEEIVRRHLLGEALLGKLLLDSLSKENFFKLFWSTTSFFFLLSKFFFSYFISGDAPPRWLIRWTSGALKFIEHERGALPFALMLPADEKKVSLVFLLFFFFLLLLFFRWPLSSKLFSIFHRSPF